VHPLTIVWKTAALGWIAPSPLAANVRHAGTVVWNGPLGVFEFEAFLECVEAKELPAIRALEG
jgi:3-phosphoglycerate kinase